MSSVTGTMDRMGSMGANTKLEIETGQLTAAAGKATSIHTASTATAPPPPPPMVTSQLDAALALLAAGSSTALSAVDTAHITATPRQQAALSQARPVLAAHDQWGAQDYTRAAATIPVIPVVRPGVTGLVPS